MMIDQAKCKGNMERGKDKRREKGSGMQNDLLGVGHSVFIIYCIIHWRMHCSQLNINLAHKL